jgi:hypothetical protein
MAAGWSEDEWLMASAISQLLIRQTISRSIPNLLRHSHDRDRECAGVVGELVIVDAQHQAAIRGHHDRLCI